VGERIIILVVIIVVSSQPMSFGPMNGIAAGAESGGRFISPSLSAPLQSQHGDASRSPDRQNRAPPQAMVTESPVKRDGAEPPHGKKRAAERSPPNKKVTFKKAKA
jgi:hypothetical protein